MSYKPIIIVAGEPNSVFFEIFFKAIKNYKAKNPLILISSIKLIQLQIKYFRIKKKIRALTFNDLYKSKLNNSKINVIDVEYVPSTIFEKSSIKTNRYINECFKIAFKILKTKKIYKFINGPIEKDIFLRKKYLGITEYISHNFSVKKKAMLIYNKKLSVCPLTTHLPLKSVAKNINKTNIIEKIKLINNFYKKNFNIIPKIAVLGLNPHCESVEKFNEDEKIVKPTINYLKKLKYKVSGPYSADTMFIKKNRDKFDVVLGMYHDQVLTPIKTLFEYDAINITLGLPFLRISPDHGPNKQMIGKNQSNPLSLIRAISFLDKN
mgnify:FL=1